MHETVIGLEAGQGLVLAQSGKARLAEVVFPDVAQADAWLAANVLQQTIDFQVLGDDRYGRLRIVSPVVERALRDGVAVLFNQDEAVPGWEEAEAAARTAKRGVWMSADFVLTPDTAAQHFGEWRVVEGAVTHIHPTKSAIFINFGEHWQTDFSVTVAGRARRRLEARLAQISAGTRVRVRGAIYSENGPMIRITQPEQLEVVGGS